MSKDLFDGEIAPEELCIALEEQRPYHVLVSALSRWIPMLIICVDTINGLDRAFIRVYPLVPDGQSVYPILLACAFSGYEVSYGSTLSTGYVVLPCRWWQTHVRRMSK